MVPVGFYSCIYSCISPAAGHAGLVPVGFRGWVVRVARPHGACCGAAMSPYWATNGPWSTGAGEAWFMVNPPVLVHRPQSQSMKDLIHLLLPRVWFT